MDRISYKSEEQVSVVEDNKELVVRPDDSDSDTEVSSHSDLENFGGLLKTLEEGERDYEAVKNSFVSGINKNNNNFRNVNVIRIKKKDYEWNIMDEARLKVFKVFVAAVASGNGGDPNLKYGWYGGSRDEIREILLHGFRSRCDDDRTTLTFGRGVCLSPADVPMESVKKSLPDPNGLRHVLLCRVILGRPEIVLYGSQKDQPSSMEFNSGVDNLSSPTKYVIWEPYMNTQILPIYLISFRADSLGGERSLRIPVSPSMGINGLIRHLTSYLSSSKMSMIMKFHHAYSKNKMSRYTFIRTLRTIAGDDILRAVVQGSR